MPAATAVKIAVGVNRRHPVALHAFVVGGLVGVGPDFLDAVVLYFQKGAAGAIGLGDEDAVADNDGAAGVGAFQCARSPAIVKTGLAGRRVQAQEAAPREQEAPAPILDRGQHGGGVTGQVVASLVADFATEL